MTEAELRECFEEYGLVEAISVVDSRSSGRNRTCCFVKFGQRDEATAAMSDLREKQPWVIEWAKSDSISESSKADKHSIFVGGLNSLQVTESALETHFGVFGELESVSLVHRSNADDYTYTTEGSAQQPRDSFAFLRFKEQNSAADAIAACNGEVWLDNTLRVQYCETKSNKKRRPRGQPSYAPSPYAYPGMYYPHGVPMVYMVPSKSFSALSERLLTLWKTVLHSVICRPAGSILFTSIRRIPTLGVKEWMSPMLQERWTTALLHGLLTTATQPVPPWLQSSPGFPKAAK